VQIKDRALNISAIKTKGKVSIKTIKISQSLKF